MKKNELKMIKLNGQLLNNDQFSILTDGNYSYQNSIVFTKTQTIIVESSSDILINQVCVTGKLSLSFSLSFHFYHILNSIYPCQVSNEGVNDKELTISIKDKLRNQSISEQIGSGFAWEHTTCSTFNATITDLVIITTATNRKIFEIDLLSISKISYDCLCSSSNLTAMIINFYFSIEFFSYKTEILSINFSKIHYPCRK